MTPRWEKSQASLFDEDEPGVVLAPAQMTELAPLVTALLLEIVVALANGETGDDEDHA